jgi:hypothetical protein
LEADRLARNISISFRIYYSSGDCGCPLSDSSRMTSMRIPTPIRILAQLTNLENINHPSTMPGFRPHITKIRPAAN